MSIYVYAQDVSISEMFDIDFDQEEFISLL